MVEATATCACVDQDAPPIALHIVSGLALSDGGPSYSVPRLVEALRAAAFDARIYTDMEPDGREEAHADFVTGFRRQYWHAPGLRSLNLSHEMWRALTRQKTKPSIIHNHGLWRMPNVYAGRAAARLDAPLVVSPRGMLAREALAFSRRRKQAFWRLMQAPALRGARCYHATSLSEYESIREFGIGSPVAIVPNGVDLPPVEQDDEDETRAAQVGARTLLFFGRIHPKKGLDALISAWALVAGEFGDWRVRIVGPGEQAHIESVRKLIAQLAAPRVSIEGPVYGAQKWRVLREADLFILPSANENFGLAVAESLACGRPVIVSKGAPWSEIETRQCGWWIDPHPSSIAAGLRRAMAAPQPELRAMGARGVEWVRREFSWDHVGRDMARTYNWLLNEAPAPSFVRLG